MPRGSKPGERRGGRKKGTPNKKTLLLNAALTPAAANPILSPLDYLLSVMRDDVLPLETRVAAAREAFPYCHSKPQQSSPDQNALDKYGAPVSNANADGPGYGGISIKISKDQERGLHSAVSKVPSSQEDSKKADQLQRDCAGELQSTITPLAFLLSVMRNPRAPATLRLRVARVLAPYIHTRPNAEASETISVADPTGFCIDPARAVELRDLNHQYKAAALKRESQPEQYKREATALSRRIEAIRLNLQWPCPSLYGEDEVKRDEERLQELEQTRQSQKKLSAHENIEEAWLTARVASYGQHPEHAASNRLRELDARRWEGYRFALEPPKPPLDASEKAEWRALEILYARPQQCEFNALKNVPAYMGGPNMLALLEKMRFANAV
jgi:hypothetical protein